MEARQAGGKAGGKAGRQAGLTAVRPHLPPVDLPSGRVRGASVIVFNFQRRKAVL